MIVDVGAVVSITIAALSDRFLPDGIVVDVIALSKASLTLPMTKLEIAKSEAVSFAPTV